MNKSYKKIRPFLIAGLATISIDTFAVDASVSPFEITPLDSGYLLTTAEEGYCGQGNCGQSNKPKNKSGSCGEGKCGGNKTDKEAVCGIYQIGSSHKDNNKVKDGKCGNHKVVESLCGEG